MSNVCPKKLLNQRNTKHQILSYFNYLFCNIVYMQALSNKEDISYVCNALFIEVCSKKYILQRDSFNTIRTKLLDVAFESM